MPVVYVSDMDRSARFYQALGFELSSRSAHWTELQAGDGAVLALRDPDGLEIQVNEHDTELTA